MKKAVIVSGARTPIGSFLGSLSSVSAPQLGAHAIAGALKKTTILPHHVSEVLMGQVLQGGVGQAPARQASLGAGIPSSVPCTTINKVCGSGLKAIMLGADSIALGTSSIVVAGGMESMSNAPYLLPAARAGFRMGNHNAIDLMLHDGLMDPYGKAHMGNFGEICAKEFAFSREAQDEYAHESYRRALAAQKQGFFKDEIVSVSVSVRGETKTIEVDEEPSRYQPDKFATLRPAFDPKGTVTAANASKVSDGAAAVVLMAEDDARAQKIPARARILAHATFAHDPQWFTTAPVGAINAVAKHANVSLSDIDLFEINEAFSVVALTAIKELNLPKDRVNVFGGAVSLGHPIGSSGARLTVTLLNALEKNNKRLGCVSLCLGGGEAVAMIIERIV